MKRLFSLVCGVILIFSGAISAGAQQNPGDVWVAPHPLSDGTVVPGYWRPPFQKGYYWVEGKEAGDGIWIPGHWNPAPGSAPADRAWAPGYWNGAVWVDGFWRPVGRPGYVWADPCWREGRWHNGHWRAYEGGQPWRGRYPR